MSKQPFLACGKIVNTHGIRGEVKIEPWADGPEFFKKIKTLYIGGEPVKLRSARPHGNFVVAALEGVEEINAAMALKNKVVSIHRDEVKLPRGHFFLADIIGAEVRDENGQVLGELSEIMERPAHDIYVVKGEREILIPAVPEFIRHTDPEQGVITVRLIEGM